MAIPNELTQLDAEGYFVRVRAGDHKAASLFARLAAYRLNPTGSSVGFGCLRKGGGQNVDGYAEDAIVANANPSDGQNVYDLVSGAGAPGASLTFNGPLPRRVGVDTWEAPKPLTEEQLAYLKGGVIVQPGPVCPDPSVHGKPLCIDLSAHAPKGYPGDRLFDEVGQQLEADYREAGQALNAQSATWFARTIFDYFAGMPLLDSIARHRAEWRAALGLR